MKRNKFSLSHYKLTTMDMGQLVPLTWYEAIPGDTIQQTTGVLIRVNPLVAPVMHPVRIRLSHFFVPNRLIWEDWEDHITGSESTEHPVLSNPTIAAGDLLDHLGLPPGGSYSDYNVSALPLRAYQFIYNEYFRDQDLVTAAVIDLTGGIDITTDDSLQNVSWEKDYFTTARPWTAKGTEVSIPIEGAGTPTFDYSTATDKNLQIKASSQDAIFQTANPTGVTQNVEWNEPALNIDIEEMRTALAIRRDQEGMAAYGNRYVDYLRLLGIRSSDARLQRPEFLGGGSGMIQFSEVLRTGNVDADATAIGDMSGHGIAANRSRRFRRFFEEHGIVMTLASVVPKAIYNDTVQRKWLRSDREDYFNKDLQYLGDQEVLNCEVQSDHSAFDSVFGYQERYSEYKHIQSEVASGFRSDYDHWHLARIFSGDVSLNESFITCNPSKRCQADTDADTLLVMSNHSIQARRKMSFHPKPRTF